MRKYVQDIPGKKDKWGSPLSFFLFIFIKVLGPTDLIHMQIRLTSNQYCLLQLCVL